MRIAILVCVLATAAFAQYVSGHGWGQSIDPSEAAGQAASKAQEELYGECDGRLRNIHVTMSCHAAGGGYTYCEARATADCEKN